MRQDVLTLRMDLTVKNNATVLTKTVIMSADVSSQQKVIYYILFLYLEDLTRFILLQTAI